MGRKKIENARYTYVSPVRVSEKEMTDINKYVEEHKFKNRSEFIRHCIFKEVYKKKVVSRLSGC